MTIRYCPRCERRLHIQSNPVVGHCPSCHWESGPREFLSEPRPPMQSSSKPWTTYVSIDTETTGLEPQWCQILEFGAVLENWHDPVDQLPYFHRYLKYTKVTGNPYALALNAEILRKIAAAAPETPLCEPEELGDLFANWLVDHKLDPKKITAAGKNFASFDLQFLYQLPQFKERIRFKHRSIDPAVLYWRPDVDEALPDTATCLKRAELDSRVAHTAIADARAVIQLIRRSASNSAGGLKMRTFFGG